MADIPTKDPKAEVEDAARGSKGSNRERRRGSGAGKKPDHRDSNSNQGPRQSKGGRDGRDGRDGRRDNRDGGFRDHRSEAPLTAGLFAGVADREMPCRIAGCTKTWTWFGTQQIRSLGKPEPKRMCAEHLATFEGIEDRAMPCRNNYCTNTWFWSRGAQLFQRERQEKLKPPHRLCDQCFEEEKTTEDTQIACKIPECRNTWMWPRQAQLRHRAWVRRMQAKIEAEEAEDDAADAADAAQAADAAPAKPVEPEGELPESAIQTLADVPLADVPQAEPDQAEPDQAQAEPKSDESEPAGDTTTADAQTQKPSKRRRRKRRRKRQINDGPPEKLCERCFERAGHLEPIEVPCKVHGCTSMWVWEREGQLRAWAVLDSRDNVTELPQPPRRMCNGCFEFVRGRGDREVACGRPDCERSWTYKTGAQLQDFLAGRTQDPIRLCEECSRSQFVISSQGGAPVPAGAEVMPCMVPGCSGSWVYAPGMSLSSADPDAVEPPVDRICDDCREQRGAPPRDPRRMPADAAEPDASPEAADDDDAAAVAETDEPDDESPPA